MNLRELLSSHPSRFTIDIAVDSIIKEPALSHELIDLLLHAPDRIPNMAAWALTVCNEQNSKLVVPYIPQLIENLPRFNHSGIVRMVLRTLLMSEIPESESGKLFDFCLKCIDQKMPIAVIANAMDILFKIAEKEPDLKNELRFIFEEQLLSEEKGIKSKANNILKKL